MIVIKKIKTIDKKVEHDKAQYDSDRKTAQISALLSGNVGKYDFLTSNNV